jgi:hypothetical protein
MTTNGHPSLSGRCANEMTRPLALTDRQLRFVTRAAKSVPAKRRSEFLQSLARHLTPAPSDAAVQAALNAQLDALATHSSNSKGVEQ